MKVSKNQLDQMAKKLTEKSRQKQSENLTEIQLHEHELGVGVEKQAKKDNNMSKELLIESNPTVLQIVESKTNGRIVVRGEFGRVGVPTLNGRIYPEKTMQREIDRLSPALSEGRVWGTVDHPKDGKTSLHDISHIITSLKIKDGIVIGEAEILRTKAGKVILDLINEGIMVPVSSRGIGSTQRSNDPKVEGEVVQDDFVLKTWDFVAEPAVITAIPRTVTEDVDSLDEDIAKIFMNEFPEITESIQKDAIEREKLKVGKGIDDAIQETEAKVRAELKESFEKQFAKAITEAKEDISKELREEFENDPDIGGAKAMLNAIWDMVSPMKLSEDEKVIADAEKARELEFASVKGELDKSKEDNVQVECKLYIERKIGSHPMVKSIRKLISKHKFENLDDAKEKLNAIMADLPDVEGESLITKKEAAIAEENAALKEKITYLTERVDVLSSKLKRAVDVGIKVNSQLEDTEIRASDFKEKLEESEKMVKDINEKLELEIYKRKMVVGLPNAKELMDLMENETSKTMVDKLVNEKGVRVSKEILEDARRKLTRGFSGSVPEDLHENLGSVVSTMNPSLMDEWERLARKA